MASSLLDLSKAPINVRLRDGGRRIEQHVIRGIIA